jgi:exopolysaccharide biosynthesis predicted pyruvyltransferase EpsI/nitroreductase
MNEERTLFWVGCFGPEMHSVGDHAQTLAVQKFLSDHFSDYKVVRFYRDEVDEFFKCKVKSDDLIFIHSSGDFGDLSYSNWHKTRKKMIASFPNVKIVQLPVTVFYRSSASFEEDKIFFSNRPNLLILTRTKKDAELLEANFDCHVRFFPDFAFYLKPKQKETSRSGVLAIIRSDLESQFKIKSADTLMRAGFRTSNLVGRIVRKGCLWLFYKPYWFYKHQRVKRYLKKKYGNVTFRDLQISNVDLTDANRETYIDSVFQEYQKYELVVTDRFHGAVFAILNKTPFLTMPEFIGHKLEGANDAVTDNYEECFDKFRSLVFTFESKIEQREEQPQMPPSTNPDSLLHLIRTRRSIRKWNNDEQVDEECLRKLLTAGAYAPTGANTQAVKFKLVKQLEDRKFVCENTSLWFRHSIPSVMILVLYDSAKAKDCKLNLKGWHNRLIWQDSACATMNIMLVAESFGLKTCWASFNPEQQQRIAKHFSLNDMVLANAVFIGYSDQKVNVNCAVHQGRPIKRSVKVVK